MSDETSSTPDFEMHLATSTRSAVSPISQTMDTCNSACGSPLPELDDAPFFVVIRPPIPGKTAWSVAPW
jgi:hypothetical protein